MNQRLALAAIVAALSLGGCGGDDEPTPYMPGVELDTDGGGPVQPAPAPDLNYAPDDGGFVPDPYANCVDITTC